MKVLGRNTKTKRHSVVTHPSCILQPKKVVLLRLATALSTARASPICTMAHPSLVFKNLI